MVDFFPKQGTASNFASWFPARDYAMTLASYRSAFFDTLLELFALSSGEADGGAVVWGAEYLSRESTR
ncbi:hypothetical protein ACDY96_34375 [Rhizobium mongolense]|uniref:hypothetical protein n=1 Tax=Rhizobium TaxID=379 RepID=UPI0024B16E7E|nr:hypothetical protein [Rhizobium sp. CC1099]WFU90236.1 hypothetical protein QA644_30040 [Rhizobium sp. CC1099]